METTLTEYLKVNKPGAFRAVPHYVRSGDYLTYFLSDRECYAKRLDDVVTLYLEPGTDRLVGCKVKDVKHILQSAGDFGVHLDGGKQVRLGFFFFVGAAPDRADREPRMKWYDLLKEFSSVEFDSSPLASCG